jgi:hypothetical protein
MSNSIPGAWTVFRFEITKDEMKVFNEALKGITGASYYNPWAVATQVVKGVNYCFLSKGKGVYPHAIETAYLLHIYADVQGPPHITQIVEIKP